MQKKNIKKLLALGLLVSGTASVAVSQAAYAAEATDQTSGTADSLEQHGHGPIPFDGKVERSVEDIENGVVITLTTDDADTLTKLQNKADEAPADDAPFADEVTREIILLDNGIQITLTSDDPSVVEKLQNMPDKPGHPSFKDLNIDRTVKNTENGVVITLTSDDQDVVEMLQDHADDEFFIGKGFRHGGPHSFDGGDSSTQE